jgi:hypothetical protein
MICLLLLGLDRPCYGGQSERGVPSACACISRRLRSGCASKSIRYFQDQWDWRDAAKVLPSN